MDILTDNSEVLDSPLSPELDATIIAEFGDWAVKDLTLTPEKVLFLWEEVNKYKALFSDFTKGDSGTFLRVLTAPDSLWYEVVDKRDGSIIGILYATEMNRIIDCEVHVLFFDHKLQEKALICRQVIAHVFELYPFRRMTVTIPSICFAIIRWAKKVGFKEEGRKRESMLMGNRWVDQVIMGILRQEIV